MLKFLLIWRYFLSRRVALLAVAAVALVVMMTLVVLSIMAGLLAETRRNNHRWTGDVVIGRDSLVGFPHYEAFIAQLAAQPDLTAAATPAIRTYGLIGNEGRAVQIWGLHLAEFCRVTGFADTLHLLADGPRDFMLPEQTRPWGATAPLTEEQRRRGFIAGRYLLGLDISRAEREFFARSGTSFAVTIFPLDSRGAILGSDFGATQTFWYLDDSDTGMPRVDADTIYVDFDELQRLCLMDGSDGFPPRASEIRLRLADGVSPERGRREVARLWEEFVAARRGAGQAALLEDVTVQTWQQYRRSHIAPAEKEKNLMVLIFAMIGGVGVFVVFAIFYMIVTEKTRDLGIIRSVGGASCQLGGIFIGYGCFVGLIGAVLGTAAGAAIVTNSNEIEAMLQKHIDFQLWNPAVYAIERIPDTVEPTQAALIALAAVGASVLGAALPAARAARLQVVEALRVE